MKSDKRTLLAGLLPVLLVGCLLNLTGVYAQDNAAQPTTQDSEPTKPTPESQQALIEDTNKTADVSQPAEEGHGFEFQRRNHGGWRPPLIVIGRDAVLPAGDAVEALVVIGGSAEVHGRVREAAVAIGGDLNIDGQIGKEAVAILGNITAHKGARVRGDAVAVGGQINVDEGASVRNRQPIDFPDMTWLRKWLIQCVLLMRPLSLKVTWVWCVAGIFFLVYLLIAALFPRPVRACVDELTQRPATTFCLGLLTILLFPVAIVILGVTGIGLLVVPFVVAAMIFGALIGRVAILEWIGGRLAFQFSSQTLNSPLTGLLLGSLVVLVLYLVPFLGLMTFAIVSLWSLGSAVTAAFGGLRREMPQKPAPDLTSAQTTTFAAIVPVQPQVAETPTPLSGSAPLAQTAPVATVPLSTAPPVVPEILTYPKASFWERLAAAFLDVILVSILCAVLHPIAPIIALAYFSGLWAWKGTTIGGIVVGLKVIRVDGKPLTFPVTLIRSLAAAFSIIVLFLGFLWIAWDSEKQGWHDKIAGTVVLKLPKGTPLLCL